MIVDPALGAVRAESPPGRPSAGGRGPKVRTVRPVRNSAVVFLRVWIAFLLLGNGLPASSFSPRRQFELSYAADFTGLPKDAGAVRIWIPLASSREGQTVLKREISAPVSYQVNVDPVYGNEMAYLEVQGPISDPLKNLET